MLTYFHTYNLLHLWFYCWNIKIECKQILHGSLYILFGKLLLFSFQWRVENERKIGISHLNIKCKFWCHGSSFFWCKVSPKGSLKGLVGKNVKHQAKNHVKSCSKQLLYIHLSMWCPFYNMLIMASCALWVIWMLKNLNWTIGSIEIEFGFEQRTFKVEHVYHQTLLV
jgi:hypothetical protein